MSVCAVLAALMVVPLIGCGSTPHDDQQEAIRVMTFNIRWASPGDGDNIWSNRSEWVASIIDSSEAHVIGLQEALRHQLDDVMRDQARLDWVGVGRDDGADQGEFSPILFDSTRLELISWDTKWLSSAPDSIGSVGWDAALPRIATRITLLDRVTLDTLQVVNTHFDHRGQQARLESSRLIGSWISDYDVALGDFNVEPDSEPYSALVEAGWMDAGIDWIPADGEPGTFRTFDAASETSVRIDYVFHAPGWTTVHYDVLSPVRDDAYPSDHLPVIADLIRE